MFLSSLSSSSSSPILGLGWVRAYGVDAFLSSPEQATSYGSFTQSLLSKHESSSKSSATKAEREKNACVKDSKGKVKAVNNEELKKIGSGMKK